MTAGDDVVVVLGTAPAEPPQLAPALARQLVDERLCACVNLLPGVQSLFRWQGKVDRADELLLLAKTTRALLPRLRQRLQQLHPYDVPELLVLPVDDGLPAYLQWVRDSVGGGAGG